MVEMIDIKILSIVMKKAAADCAALVLAQRSIGAFFCSRTLKLIKIENKKIVDFVGKAENSKSEKKRRWK